MIKTLSRGKGISSPFADFIRNAKSDEKKRVYNDVLNEATRQQNAVMASVACTHRR